MDRQIVTSHEFPPIPDRRFDWCAHYEGAEEAGGYGWGRTEAEAIADFKANYADEPEEEFEPNAEQLGALDCRAKKDGDHVNPFDRFDQPDSWDEYRRGYEAEMRRVA